MTHDCARWVSICCGVSAIATPTLLSAGAAQASPEGESSPVPVPASAALDPVSVADREPLTVAMPDIAAPVAPAPPAFAAVQAEVSLPVVSGSDAESTEGASTEVERTDASQPEAAPLNEAMTSPTTDAAPAAPVPSIPATAAINEGQPQPVSDPASTVTVTTEDQPVTPRPQSQSPAAPVNEIEGIAAETHAPSVAPTEPQALVATTRAATPASAPAPFLAVEPATTRDPLANPGSTTAAPSAITGTATDLSAGASYVVSQEIVSRNTQTEITPNYDFELSAAEMAAEQTPQNTAPQNLDSALDQLGLQFEDVRTETEVAELDIDYAAAAELQAGTARTTRYMANAYYDVPTGSAVRPYVGAGVGYANIALRPDSATATRTTETRMAYQLRAGLRYEVAPQVMLNVGYRYFAVPGQVQMGGNPQSISSSAIELGVQARF
ncbi:MAG: outer membrane beta-barrel protein [Cyanobacteria bacterium J06632_22]